MLSLLPEITQQICVRPSVSLLCFGPEFVVGRDHEKMRRKTEFLLMEPPVHGEKRDPARELHTLCVGGWAGEVRLELLPHIAIGWGRAVGGSGGWLILPVFTPLCSFCSPCWRGLDFPALSWLLALLADGEVL